GAGNHAGGCIARAADDGAAEYAVHALPVGRDVDAEELTGRAVRGCVAFERVSGGEVVRKYARIVGEDVRRGLDGREPSGRHRPERRYVGRAPGAVRNG